MRTRSIVVWFALAISLVGNLWLFVLLVNAGAHVGDARSQVETLKERRTTALEILRYEWMGRSVSDLDTMKDDLAAQGVRVDVEGETREIGTFIFEVEEGVITEVRDYSGR